MVLVSEYPGQGGEGGGEKKEAAPAADYQFLDVISGHPGQGGEGRGARGRAMEGRQEWGEVKFSIGVNI